MKAQVIFFLFLLINGALSGKAPQTSDPDSTLSVYGDDEPTGYSEGGGPSSAVGAQPQKKGWFKNLFTRSSNEGNNDDELRVGEPPKKRPLFGNFFKKSETRPPLPRGASMANGWLKTKNFFNNFRFGFVKSEKKKEKFRQYHEDLKTRTDAHLTSPDDPSLGRALGKGTRVAAAVTGGTAAVVGGVALAAVAPLPVTAAVGVGAVMAGAQMYHARKMNNQVNELNGKISELNEKVDAYAGNNGNDHLALVNAHDGGNEYSNTGISVPSIPDLNQKSNTNVYGAYDRTYYMHSSPLMNNNYQDAYARRVKTQNSYATVDEEPEPSIN